MGIERKKTGFRIHQNLRAYLTMLKTNTRLIVTLCCSSDDDVQRINEISCVIWLTQKQLLCKFTILLKMTRHSILPIFGWQTVGFQRQYFSSQSVLLVQFSFAFSRKGCTQQHGYYATCVHSFMNGVMWCSQPKKAWHGNVNKERHSNIKTCHNKNTLCLLSFIGRSPLQECICQNSNSTRNVWFFIRRTRTYPEEPGLGFLFPKCRQDVDHLFQSHLLFKSVIVQQIS